MVNESCSLAATLPDDFNDFLSEEEKTDPLEDRWRLYKMRKVSEPSKKERLNSCYEGIIEILRYYIDMSEDNYKIIALWIIGTYFHEQFNTFPYLFFNAMRGAAKTRTLKLISSLAAKGDGSIQNNLTEAVLFRIPRGTTTCIDEIEQIGSKEKQTLRELLNSAYKKGMKVKRMHKVKNKDGETQVAEVFEPYFPIALANIWGVEEVLGDRSIVITLEKSNNPVVVKKIEDFDTNETIKLLKRTFSVVIVMSLCSRRYIEDWNNYIQQKYNDTTTLTTNTYITTLTTLSKEEIERDEFFNLIEKSNISGRNFELFFPLLIIAKEIDDDVFQDFLEIAKRTVSQKKDDEYIESKDVSLYDFINSITDEGLNYVGVKDLARRFREFLGETDEEDRWLNEKWLGRALKRLNLVLAKKRLPTGRFIILNYAKAKEKIKLFKETNKDD